MLVPEQKLTIQITKVDCVKVDNVYFAETGERKVFEQLTSNTASADQ